MKLHYYKETDSLYIDLSSKSSIDSQEITEDIVIDFDEKKNIVGIDIQNASKNIDFSSLEADEIPIKKVLINQK
jgi:uncharacterized protein YuzE